jgi:hypothetical protein
VATAATVGSCGGTPTPDAGSAPDAMMSMETAPAGGFSGDCLYHLSKPNFTLDDCLAGATPGFPPANLPADWETLECLAFDAAI